MEIIVLNVLGFGMLLGLIAAGHNIFVAGMAAIIAVLFVYFVTAYYG